MGMAALFLGFLGAKNRLRGFWRINDFVLWGRFSWGPIVRIVAFVANRTSFTEI